MTKKLIITTDFSSKLKLFNLSKKILLNLKKIHKNIIVKKINLNKIKLDEQTTIYWGTRINDKIINFFPNLKWIHFGSVGVDKLSYDRIKKKDITVTNSKLINTESIFNLIVLYLLDTTKKLLINKEHYKNRFEYEKIFLNTCDLTKQKILILGYGNVAKKIQKFSIFSKLNIKIFSRRNNIIKKNKEIFVSLRRMNGTINQYDTIINLLPNNRFNKNFLNKKIFLRLKKNVSLILVGRLETVDLENLCVFLRKNKNSSCYIDAVTNVGNAKIFNQIKRLKNTFVSPHIGGYSHSYWINQLNLFNLNLNLFKRNKKMVNIVKISKHNFS